MQGTRVLLQMASRPPTLKRMTGALPKMAGRQGLPAADADQLALSILAMAIASEIVSTL